MPHGDMPAGPNMAVQASIQQAAGSTGGQQLWLGGWVACLDFKALMNMAELAPFLKNNILPGAGGIMPIPAAGLALTNLAIFRELAEILKAGGGIEQYAGDVTDAIRELMDAGVGGVSDNMDQLKAMLGQMPSQMAHLAELQRGADGPSVMS